MAVCNSSEVNISSSLWLISYTQNFKELSWVFLNSRLHSVAAIERRTIVCWEIAFSKKSYRIETSQCKYKSIDRFLYDSNFFLVSWLLVNNNILRGRRHHWEFFFLRLITRPTKKKTLSDGFYGNNSFFFFTTKYVVQILLWKTWERVNFTKDINRYFFTILHGANNGRQPFKGVS